MKEQYLQLIRDIKLYKRPFDFDDVPTYLGDTTNTICWYFIKPGEPGGTFCPMSEEEAQQIQLVELPLAYDFVIDADCG